MLCASIRGRKAMADSANYVRQFFAVTAVGRELWHVSIEGEKSQAKLVELGLGVRHELLPKIGDELPAKPAIGICIDGLVSYENYSRAVPRGIVFTSPPEKGGEETWTGPLAGVFLCHDEARACLAAEGIGTLDRRWLSSTEQTVAAFADHPFFRCSEKLKSRIASMVSAVAC
jgi:hypothetical protein